MKRSGSCKFPHSVQLFKFCQKVLMHRKGGKVRDQEVGSILNFNPSDCSHWKRGEKNVRSVFALAKLAEALNVETSLIHEVASAAVNLEEAYFEYLESQAFCDAFKAVASADRQVYEATRARVQSFVDTLHNQIEFMTPPLYLPEVIRAFSFVSTQPIDMMDKLSRILRVKPGQYCIQYRKGDLKPQTRMSMVKDLARVIFEGERARFPELGEPVPELIQFEEILFTANLLAPKSMFMAEMAKLDTRKNVVAELSALFWVPKSLVGLQMQEIVRHGAEASRSGSISGENRAISEQVTL